MTEAEIFELIQLAYSNALSCFAIFLTIIGAYLVAAYQAGSKLSFSEILIVNILFITACLVNVYATAAFTLVAHNLSVEVLEINPGRDRYDHPLLVILMVSIEVAAVLACLWFMRGRRNRGKSNKST